MQVRGHVANVDTSIVLRQGALGILPSKRQVEVVLRLVARDGDA